jgi:hypothetical protein
MLAAVASGTLSVVAALLLLWWLCFHFGLGDFQRFVNRVVYGPW